MSSRQPQLRSNLQISSMSSFANLESLNNPISITAGVLPNSERKALPADIFCKGSWDHARCGFHLWGCFWTSTTMSLGRPILYSVVVFTNSKFSKGARGADDDVGDSVRRRLHHPVNTKLPINGNLHAKREVELDRSIPDLYLFTCIYSLKRLYILDD